MILRSITQSDPITVPSKIYESVMVVPAPIIQFRPITEAVMQVFSLACVDDPISVLFPMVQVLIASFEQVGHSENQR